jgi:hypothetical protein
MLSPGVEDRIARRLTATLGSGEWDPEHGHPREHDAYDGAYVLLRLRTDSRCPGRVKGARKRR